MDRTDDLFSYIAVGDVTVGTNQAREPVVLRQVLVKDIDHFCPWTGTTIGGGNIRCFHCFVSAICVNFMVIGMYCFGSWFDLVFCTFFICFCLACCTKAGT